MALNFPGSPTNGQQYQGFVYNSSVQAWQSNPASVAPFYTADTPPANPTKGDSWFNTNDGTMYIYTYDGNTYQWVEHRSQIAKSQVGLVPIVPTSVTVSAGTATVDINGNVTFTSAANINLAGIFSSTYKHYRIVTDIDTSAAADTLAWFSNSGTSVTAGWYGMSQYSVYNSTTYTSAGGRTNGNGAYLGYGASSGNPATIYMNIFRTASKVQLEYVNYSRSFGGTFYGGYGTDATSADGFKFSAANTALYTGTMKVYGYN